MTLKLQEPLKAGGTRPKGARDEREAAARVRDMFTRIAPRYDLLNHLLSFSLDHAWRRRTARRFQRVLRRTDARVLDLCCGTGDLAFALDRVRMHALRDDGAYRVPIMGADFAQPMVERARKKAGHHGRAAVFVAADALRLPFPDASFDLVTSAFGFRNLANYEEGLREIARVLKPGGQVGILEFSQPDGPDGGNIPILFPVHHAADRRSHFRKRSGIFLSAQLSGEVSITGRTGGADAETGFEEVSAVSWNFGSVVLHSAKLS